MTMKVLIADKVDPGCRTILEGRGLVADENTGLAPPQLLQVIGEYDGLIVRSSTNVTEELIGAARRLRVIGRAGTGVDNIDVGAATRRGVVVTNTPGGNSVSAAELAFGMLMSLARDIPQATASLKGGEWNRSSYTGVELAAKTIGVVGLGKIGREVVQRSVAFRMKVLGYDPFVSEEAANSFGAQLSSIEEVLENSDFITLHLPLTSQTEHFISDEQLSQCKDGVLLINCARGGIIDEAAVVRALDSGKVGGAAFDVFEQEPPQNSALVNHERVICTPHLGASTREAQVNVALQVAEQVGEILTDRIIRNAVNVPSVEPEVYSKLRPFLDLAERLGRIHAQLSEGQLERITIEYLGDVTNQPTPPLTAAVLKGIMEAISDEPVNFVNAPIFAQERGISVDERRSSEHEDFTSLVSVTYHTDVSSRILCGTIFGKSDPRIVRLDEYDFDAVPEGHMLFYENADVPGVIGKVGTIMGSHQVNIAQMTCGRHEVGGRALTILNVDSAIPDPVLADLRSEDYITWAKPVSLE